MVFGVQFWFLFLLIGATTLAQDPPTISSFSNSYKTITRGSSYTVFCKSTSSPKPKVTWRKDGVILDTENDPNYEIQLPDYDLYIPFTNEETAGKYRCILSNENGETEIGWDLTLVVGFLGDKYAYPPRDNYFYESAEVPIAWTNCMSPPAKPPAVVTFINGSSNLPVDPDTDPRIELRSFIQGTNQLHQLIITGATEYDTHEKWGCRAVNQYGEEIRYFKIERFGSPPAPSNIQIIHRLNGFIIKWDYVRNDLVYYDIVVKSSAKTHEFRLKESVDPNVKYTLQYEVKELEQGVTYTLQMRAFDRGNNTGAWSEPLEVTTVTTSAPYVEQPLPVEIRAGEGLKHLIECDIRGKPLPDIEWKKDGQKISLQDSDYEIDLKAGTLVIVSPIREKTNGMYQCVGTNIHGTAESNEAKLTTEWIEEEFQTYPRNQTFFKGVQFLRFSCRPPKGNPEPKVVWIFNGFPINTQTYPNLQPTNYHGPTGNFFYALDVRNPVTVLAGSYACVATNAGGRRFGNFEIEEILPKKPFITREISRFNTFTENKTVSVTKKLECRYLGDPTPSITWYKDDEPVDLSDSMFSVSENGEELSLVGINKLHRGEYYCNASNIHGWTATPKAEVNVIYMDTEYEFWESETQVYDVDGHRDVEVVCQPPRGYPKSSIVWANGTDDNLQYAENPDLTYITNNRSLNLYVMKVANAKKYLGDQIGCAAYNARIGFTGYLIRLTTLVLAGAPILKNVQYNFESHEKLTLSFELDKPRNDVTYMIELMRGNEVVMKTETQDTAYEVEQSFVGFSEMSVTVTAVDKAGQQNGEFVKRIDDEDIPIAPPPTTTPEPPTTTTPKPPPTTSEPLPSIESSVPTPVESTTSSATEQKVIAVSTSSSTTTTENVQTATTTVQSFTSTEATTTTTEAPVVVPIATTSSATSVAVEPTPSTTSATTTAAATTETGSATEPPKVVVPSTSNSISPTPVIAPSTETSTSTPKLTTTTSSVTKAQATTSAESSTKKTPLEPFTEVEDKKPSFMEKPMDMSIKSSPSSAAVSATADVNESTKSGSPESSKSDSELKDSHLIAIICGGVALVVMIAIIALVVLRRSNAKYQTTGGSSP